MRGVGYQSKVGHQGGGLFLKVVLSKGDEVDVLPWKQSSNAGGGGGQPVVGGGGNEKGALVAQVRLDRKSGV